MSLRISEMQDAGTPNGSELVEVSQLSATVRRTSTGLSFSAIDNSINDAAFGFVSAGFTVGDTVQVSGSASNDRASAVVTALTSGKMILGATLTTEAAGASVTVAQWVTRSTPLPSGGGGSDWGGIGGTLSSQTDLQSALDAKSSARLSTLAVTGDLTLTTGHLGVVVYTVAGTSADIDITVPAGLGDGFHCSFIHRGSGAFTIVASGATVNPQAGGTLVLPQNGRASIIESGGADIYDLVGIVEAA